MISAPRRPGDQPDGRPLPRAGGPPPRPGLPPHLRPGDHRAEGADPAVEHLRRRGRPDPRLPRRRARWRWSASLHQMEDYIQQVLAFDVAQGEPVRVEKMVALFTSHDNAITETLTAAGRHVLRCPDFADGAGRARVGVDGAVGRLRRRSCRANRACSCCCGSTRPTCCRSARGTPRGTTRASRPAGSTARPTAATCSGTSSSSIRSSTSGCPESPAGCCSTATAGCPRRGRRRARRATGARCSRGRAAATAPRRPRSCTSTRCPGSGTPTTATTSAT